jgi:hypothetical protein
MKTTTNQNHTGGSPDPLEPLREGGRLLYQVICTLYVLNQGRRVKSLTDALEKQWVHIPINKPKEADTTHKGGLLRRYIDGDIVPYSKDSGSGFYKQVIAHLQKSGLINVRTVEGRHQYKPLQDPYRYANLSALCPKVEPLPQPFEYMRAMLHRVSLPVTNDALTPYLRYALPYLQEPAHIGAFFKIDSFSGRVHTPITSMSTELRKLLRIDQSSTIALDVRTMQPSLLGAILRDELPENEFTQLIDEGRDVYTMLQLRAGLNKREDAKELFFNIAFGEPSNELAALFGSVDWVNWINELKSKPIEGKPQKYSGKHHNNLAYLLQRKEVEVMAGIWSQLQRESIPFLTVHDEVITTRINERRTLEIMKEALSAVLVNPLITIK